MEHELSEQDIQKFPVGNFLRVPGKTWGE